MGPTSQDSPPRVWRRSSEGLQDGSVWFPTQLSGLCEQMAAENVTQI